MIDAVRRPCTLLSVLMLLCPLAVNADQPSACSNNLALALFVSRPALFAWCCALHDVVVLLMTDHQQHHYSRKIGQAWGSCNQPLQQQENVVALSENGAKILTVHESAEPLLQDEQQ